MISEKPEHFLQNSFFSSRIEFIVYFLLRWCSLLHYEESIIQYLLLFCISYFFPRVIFNTKVSQILLMQKLKQKLAVMFVPMWNAVLHIQAPCSRN